jgi:hypothetical protein
MKIVIARTVIVNVEMAATAEVNDAVEITTFSGATCPKPNKPPIWKPIWLNSISRSRQWRNGLQI